MVRIAWVALAVPLLCACAPRAGAARSPAPTLAGRRAPEPEPAPQAARAPIDLEAARRHARRRVEEILAENPDRVAARIDKGRLLVDDAERLGTQAAFARAEAWLRETLERRPGHPTVLVSLARLELARGEIDLAVLMAGEAARATAGERLPAELLVVWGRIWLRRGDENRALRAFARAIEADPSWGEAHARAALVRVAMRDYASGLRDLDRAEHLDARLSDHPELLRARAAAHLGLLDLAKAREAARRLAAVDPDHPRTRHLRAELRLRGDAGALGDAHDPDAAGRLAARQAERLEKLERASRAAERPRLLQREREARAAHEAYVRGLERGDP